MRKLKSILTAALLMLVLCAPILADDGNIGTPGNPGNIGTPGVTVNEILTALLMVVI